MTTGEIVQNSVYMYKILNGKFKCFEGYIVRYPQRRDVFYVRDTKKYYTVSEQPYEIHCGNVWMFERDDAKARMAFKKFFEENIAELERRIESYHELIDLVKRDS